MSAKKLAYLLAFSLLLGLGGFAHAAQDSDNRYLVKTQSTFWKNSLGARNHFDDGFTADLSDWQVRLTKIFGIEIEPVKKLYILPAEVLKQSKPIPQRQVPLAQLPWGVSDVYNDPALTKTSGGKDVNVAVLDTGVFGTHLDLVNRIKQCKDFTGVKSVIDGKCDDKNGHGTHVSGIIAADGGKDGKGIYGVASEANLFEYKVCDPSGSCWADDIATAIRTAVDGGVNIINMSLGGDAASSLMKNAIDYAVSKHVLVVAASGNDGLGADDINSIDYPAAFSNVVGVGAFDTLLKVADWSSRGNNSKTDLLTHDEGDLYFAAPGVNIESTWKDGGYAILSGTSMATPHITGLAAKLWQLDNLTPDSNVKSVLEKLSQDIDNIGEDNASGLGFPQL